MRLRIWFFPSELPFQGDGLASLEAGDATDFNEFGSILVAGLPERHYICGTRRKVRVPMPRTKNEVLTIRTTAEVKALLRLAAEKERRSAATMIEVLVLDYAASHDLVVPEPDRPGRRGNSN